MVCDHINNYMVDKLKQTVIKITIKPRQNKNFNSFFPAIRHTNIFQKLQWCKIKLQTTKM